MSALFNAPQRHLSRFRHFRFIQYQVSAHINYLIDVFDEHGTSFHAGAASSAVPDHLRCYHASYHRNLSLFTADTVFLPWKKDSVSGEKAEVSMIGGVITPEVIWDCTTCRACMEACPMFIEHIDKIIDMRRNLVLDKAEMPETAEMALRCIEERGHTCKGTTACRLDWFADTGGDKPKAQKTKIHILY